MPSDAIVAVESRDLLHRVAMLERENSALSAEIGRLDKINRNLMGHSQQLSRQGGDLRCQTLQADLAEAKQKLGALEAENAELLDEKLELRQQLALLTADNEILSQDIITLSQLVNELNATNLAQAQAAEGTGMDGASESHDLTTLSDATQGSGAELTTYFALQNRLSTTVPPPPCTRDNFYRLIEAINSLKAELSDIYAACPEPTRLREQLRALSTRDDLDTTKKIGGLENKLCLAESRIMELEVTLTDYERQASASRATEEENIKLRGELAAAQAHAAINESLSREAAELREQVRSLELELAQKAGMLATTDGQLEDARSRAAELDSVSDRLQRAETAHRELEQKYGRTAQLLELAQEELQRYQTGTKRTSETLEAELAMLRGLLETKDGQLRDATEQFEHLLELKKRQDTKLNEVYDLRKNFEYMRERFEPMQREVEKLRAKEREYSTILSTLDGTSARTDARLREIEERYRQDLRRKDEVIAGLKSEKLRLNEEIIALRTSLHVRDEDSRRARLASTLSVAAAIPVPGEPQDVATPSVTPAARPPIVPLSTDLQVTSGKQAAGLGAGTGLAGLRSSAIIASRGYGGGALVAQTPSHI
ncbi:hypothetical protein GMRT_15838 [Giardia muris]|uniref:Coiled-coil protein n=1 Tax=Giardia muris TaxID=5742 RepID=A0A4Z1SLS2_GIAMU|nr:hypothetical protein GMRT_15838 [Giardia muris]|eukprot:TNJ26604.1 hypothetical protein GMRT_15838 [Giardia muris]